MDHPDALNSDQIGRSDLPLTVDGSGSRDLHRMAAIVRDLGDARGAIAITRSPSDGGASSRKTSTIAVRSSRDRGSFGEIVAHNRFEG